MGTIHELLPKIMAEVGTIAKDRKNAQQGFMFRGIEDVYKHLQLLMAKHGVTALPEVLDIQREERQTAKGGTMFSTILRVKYTFFAGDGTNCSATVAGEGMDSGDKATSKAMSIAHKNCLLQAFMVPTEDAVDPDRETPELGEMPRITDDQLGVLTDMILSTETDEKKFLEFFKINTLDDLMATNYNRALAMLNAKAKKQAEG